MTGAGTGPEHATSAGHAPPGTMRIAFGRQVCGALEAASTREWLVADGLGGYACGTVAGLRTRGYHGLLMTATEPAGAARMLGLAALDVVVVTAGRRVPLSTHEWSGGAIEPRGYERLASFDLDDGVPRWRYDLGATQLEVELAMAHGTPTVAVVLRLLAGQARLELTPLCTWRDQHGTRYGTADPAVVAVPGGFTFEDAYRVDGPGFTPGGSWYRREYHREEAARGQGATEDLWAAGTFEANLAAGEAVGVTATADLASDAPDAVAVVAAARERAGTLAALADARDDVDRILAVAVDRFVVRTPTGPTAVAGYPWFGEWSRDLFTSYEGLFLCTGRADEGAAVLRRAAGTVSEGMLANTADVGGREYNTIDGTLWFLHALGRHLALTADAALAADVAGTVLEILTWHRDGTRFGIGVDAETGLLRGGADGWALTWMDARVDGEPITPRRGMPVEIQGLWINGLQVAVDLLASTGRDATPWADLRSRAVASFARLFALGDAGLPDAIDPTGHASAELRPNQLLAVSLPHGPVQDPAAAARVVGACRGGLLTSLGLRSLAPSDPAFRARHRGSPAQRDSAYHQGTVWPWLIGPFVDAARRAGRVVPGELDGLVLHLAEDGLGSVSETADGAAPHGTTGCPFQAWSVAELMRARRALR